MELICFEVYVKSKLSINTTSWDLLINRRSALCSSIHAQKERKSIIAAIQKEKEDKDGKGKGEEGKEKENIKSNPIKKLLEKRFKKIEKLPTVTGK